ncbi:SKP1/ASK-interacting protein 16 isoform 2 [Hibiscus syriacus]|uniref:SKP1/ASK-interacting protein 16 isoform 2 n=1 Tax=Hibiscus syriacus TaxID=106335 RepID=A0A6A3CBG6_HIBSY|nr:uncharacterized protein LOC120200885 isoform X1 [Hibiscus syriacus]KAE8726550.1 SKP1/ASK-interacting protein 16 isoform 2 [Hibiscus syriacus]
MHSFSLKFFTDLNSGATRSTCFPARLDHGLAIDLDFGRRKRVGSGCWDRDSAARKCWVVSCAVDGNGTGGNAGGGEIPSLDPNPTQNQRSFLSRSQTYATLKQQMEAAAKSEDYKEAARIRDSLKIFEEEEPVLRFRKLIKEAVAAERFEDAARYRDELKEIAPHSLLKCSSDATTLGIRVQVRSVYIEGRSLPSRGQYFFAYRIRITNNSDRPVQLLRRHWIITDGNEKTENVWGIGVIGEQPVILPKTGFEYSSACPLSTPSGRMEGDFEMKHIDRVGSPTFNVAIAPFSLSTLRDDANTF